MAARCAVAMTVWKLGAVGLVLSRMATQPPSPDLVPAPPALPALPGIPAVAPVPGIAATGLNYPVTGVPRTADELRQLKARRTELSNQLESATSRRTNIAQRLRSSQNGPADGADRAGLEQHLAQLDARIVQLESDITMTGQQLAAAPALAGTVQPPRSSRPGRGEAVGMFFSFLILVPLAIALFRMMWRRGGRQAPARDNPESTQRLARLETAIDSIAIEMERVSEGQRFVTRLLSESQVVPRLDPVRETAPLLHVTPHR